MRIRVQAMLAAFLLTSAGCLGDNGAGMGFSQLNPSYGLEVSLPSGSEDVELVVTRDDQVLQPGGGYDGDGNPRPYYWTSSICYEDNQSPDALGCVWDEGDVRVPETSAHWYTVYVYRRPGGSTGRDLQLKVGITHSDVERGFKVNLNPSDLGCVARISTDAPGGPRIDPCGEPTKPNYPAPQRFSGPV